MADINPSYRSLVDGNQDVFRYGLATLEQSTYEDPTYIGFTIELDETSALFNDVLPFLEKHASTRAEMKARIPVYNEFIRRVKQVFNSQESIVSPNDKTEFIKQHYINSVAGLDTLTKKMISWREDKLSFVMHEDIGLYSSYLAYLYNNLVYSYENGRVIIPENLVKFNCYIKMSEVRSLTSVKNLISNNASERAIANALKNSVTSIIYKLYDCEYDFFNSRPFENEIAQSGIDTPQPIHSLVSFDMYFKSVSRQIYTPLINGSVSMNDDRTDLDIIVNITPSNTSLDGVPKDPSKTDITTDGNAPQTGSVQSVSAFKQESFMNESSKKPSSPATSSFEKQGLNDDDIRGRDKALNEITSYNDEFVADRKEQEQAAILRAAGQVADQDSTDLTLDNAGGDGALQQLLNDPQAALSAYGDKLKGVGKNALLSQLKAARKQIVNRRNELVRAFVSQAVQQTGIKKIVPDNVYKDKDFLQETLDQIAGSVGNTVASEVVSELTNNNTIPGLDGGIGNTLNNFIQGL